MPVSFDRLEEDGIHKTPLELDDVSPILKMIELPARELQPRTEMKFFGEIHIQRSDVAEVYALIRLPSHMMRVTRGNVQKTYSVSGDEFLAIVNLVRSKQGLAAWRKGEPLLPGMTPQDSP